MKSPENSSPAPQELEGLLDEFHIAAQSSALTSAFDAAREAIVSYEARNQEALRLAAIRLGILADRMEGCNETAREEGRKPTHELMDEARMFEREAREAAGMEPRS